MLGGPTGTLSQVLGKWMKPTPQGLVRYYSAGDTAIGTVSVPITSRLACQAEYNWQVPGSWGLGLLPVCAHYGAKDRNAGLTMLRLQTG